MNLFDMFESGKKQDIEEACWKGYHKEGMKTMFGKRYPNCVKNKNESLETYVNKGECPGCGGAMVSEEQINEKQDACYHKVKSRYKVWPSAYASGALVQCRKKGANNWGNKSEGALNEFAPGSDDGNNGEEDTLLKYAKLWYNGDLETQQQVEKLLDRMGWEIGEIESEEGGAFVVQPGDEHGRSYIGWTAADLIEEQLDENLRQWFSDKWVRFGPDGKIRGDCARGDSSEGKPKCLPQSKAHALGKKGRASAAARKRREDPNPERSGKAINVNTKKKTSEGVAEGVNDYLWHGSKSQHDILYPQQANDTGGKEESNKNAIYATPNAKVAIAMGLTTPGSDTGMFPNDPQMVLFKGGIRKGEMIYLHKVPKDLFIKHNNREWYSKPDVKEITPIEIKKIPVDKYLNLIRTATPQDLELQKKYMKKQGVAEGSNDTIYPNAEVIKSKNGKPIGEIYQDGNSWGAFHYRADRGYDFIDSREEAIEALRDLHQETGRSRPDYTIKGVAEGNDDHIWGPQGNFAGDRIVNLGGVTMKTVEVGDTVKYFGQKAKVVAMSKDRKHSRINILSDFGGTTRDVLTSDLKQLGQGVAEGYEPGDKITWYHSNHHPEIEGTVVGWKDGHLIVKSIDPQPRNTEKTVAKYRVPKNNILSHDKQGVAEAATDDPRFQKAMGNIVNTTPRAVVQYPSDLISPDASPDERDRLSTPIRRPNAKVFQKMLNNFLDMRKDGVDTEEALDNIRYDLEQSDYEWTDDEIASILGDLNANDIPDDDRFESQGVAEGSNELYQKAIRKYAQQVANDYLGGGNDYLYGANKFDSEMFGVDPKQAQQDFKTLFAQLTKQQGVAEGSSDTVYPNAEVIKSKNGKPVGEIYQDGNSWGAFHYRADRGYDLIDSREDAIEALRDLHQETGRSRPDYTIKGVAEASISTQVNLPKWQIGLPVFVKHLGQKGKIASLSNDSAIVDVGMRQYRVPLDGLKRYPSRGVTEGSNKKQEATRRIQKMLNDKFGANLDVDGVLGPLTLKSINKFMPNAKVGPAKDPNKTTAVQGKKVKNEDIDQNQLAEKWSQKYKSSINCSNPKGFSQRAHCDGKKKNEDVTETTEYNYSNINDDDWYEFDSEGNVVRQSGPGRYELPFGSNRTIKLPNGNIAAKGMTAKRLKLFKNLSESREYYNVTSTDSTSLRQDFNMSKDRFGWYLSEGSTPKHKLDAYRAFGSPKLKEYDLSAFSGGTQTKGEDNVISPVGSQTRSQYKK
jgi:hypothetical protein